MKERLLRFDIIRIVAICMVLMIHITVLPVLFSADTRSAGFILSNIINGIGRAGVPMFLMLSGALLLDDSRKIDAKKFYRKSFFPIVVLLLVWLLFYACWRSFLLPAITGQPVENGHFLKYVLTLTGLYPHLWYLFALVGIYLAVPVLRLFVKKENRNYILGIIILSLIARFGTQTLGVFTRNSEIKIGDFMTKFHLEYATGFFPYLLMGWYINSFPPKKEHRTLIYLAGAAALIGSILSVQVFIREIPDIFDYVMEAFTLPAAVYGIAVFTLICDLVKDKKTESKLVAELSQSSFGVYILHVVVLDLLTWKLFPLYGYTMNPVFYLLVLFVLTYAACLIVVLPLSKVQGVRKLFHYK